MEEPEPQNMEAQQINPLPQEDKKFFNLPDKHLVTLYKHFDYFYHEPLDAEAYNKYDACCQVLGVVPLVKVDYDRENRPSEPHRSENGQDLEPESHYKKRVVEKPNLFKQNEKGLNR